MQKNQCLQCQILENSQKYYPLVIFIEKYQFLSTNNPYQSLSIRWNQLLLNFKIKRQRYPLLSIKKTRKKNHWANRRAACVTLTLTRRYLFQFQQHQYQHADSFAMSMASCAVVFVFVFWCIVWYSAIGQRWCNGAPVSIHTTEIFAELRWCLFDCVDFGCGSWMAIFFCFTD